MSAEVGKQVLGQLRGKQETTPVPRTTALIKSIPTKPVITSPMRITAKEPKQVPKKEPKQLPKQEPMEEMKTPERTPAIKQEERSPQKSKRDLWERSRPKEIWSFWKRNIQRWTKTIKRKCWVIWRWNMAPRRQPPPAHWRKSFVRKSNQQKNKFLDL